MSHYPIPSYAASIWIAGDQLWLAVPEASSIPFPATARGLEAALAVLRTRARDTDRRIGTRASPVKSDIERAVSSSARYKKWIETMAEDAEAKAKAKAEATAFLTELGL